MSERIKSFTSAEEIFCGKHTRFISISEYESSDDDQDESAARSPAGNTKSLDRPTTCPNLSASEEMMRLGLKAEVDLGLPTASGSAGYSKDIRQSKSKRKHDDAQSSMALPKKAPKIDVDRAELFTRRNKKGLKLSQRWNEESDGTNDFSNGDDSIKIFVNTWREACRTNGVDEVFQRMLQFYKARKKTKMTRLFSSYPFCGLLQVAVRSEKLLTALGLKTQVTVDDTLTILNVWRAKASLSASLSQMSKFYAFIWSRMNTSERKVVEELCNGPFVFVPCKLVASLEDVIPGVFLSSKEVFWRDSTGSVDQVKMVCPEFDPHSVQHPFTKMLCSMYPALHDFFVKECGVDELPHFRRYLQILLQLSAAALPSQAAKSVFHIFLKWVNELNSGSLRSEDIGFLREGLLTKDYLVLPTAEDKWVSLDPSFGLICWCDDDKLRKEFKYFDNITFLYFGQLNDEEKEILRTKVSVFMHKLNIPSLSEVVTREAIYDGSTDSSFVASVVNWALPYAQRYIYSVHPDKYLQLSQSRFRNLKYLQIVVVEKLFFRNVIKSSQIASKKRFECSCLLEGNILYATQESDSHSIFMEISRLFSSGTPDLHLANFLHMITTMAESGSNEEQTEFFILNSQKMPKLPAGESVWSLGNVPLSTDSETGMMSSSRTIDEKNPVKIKKRPGIISNWPPTDWKTAPGFRRSSVCVAKSEAARGIQSKEETVEEIVIITCELPPTEMTCVENVDNGPAADAVVVGCNVLVPGTMKEAFDSSHPMTEPQDVNYSSSDVTERDQLYVGTTDAQWETGRLGEFFAFKYFSEKLGEPLVKWVNETNETGLPYDLVVGDDEYIEVKATRLMGKDWFHISSREWQFAVKKGESFSVAHVVLLPNNSAAVTVYKNPFRLCQLGKLQLALTISKS